MKSFICEVKESNYTFSKAQILRALSVDVERLRLVRHFEDDTLKYGTQLWGGNCDTLGIWESS